MSLRGSLATMPAADLFDWTARRAPTGEVTLERGGLSRRFRVAGGALVSATSNIATEFLGQILLVGGALSEEQLRAAFLAQASSGALLGKVLVDGGLATVEAVREAIELKIRESLFEALSWDEGLFRFEPDAGPPPGAGIEVGVPLAGALAEGAARAERWREIHALIPGEDARFFLPDRGWLERAKPGSPSAVLLEDVVRGATAREMILSHRSLPFPILNRLAELMGRGILKLDRRHKLRTTPDADLAPADLVEAARGRARGGDRRGALDLVRRALAASPADEALRRASEEIERGVLAELARALLARYTVPRLLKTAEELDAIELTAEERCLVGRVDGRWDLLSIMRVSPLRELDALLAFQRLAEQGIVAL